MKTTLLSTNCIQRSLGRSALLSFLICCFGLLPKAQAVSPAPDGGYPGGNTAEGQAALLNLTTGGYNTAVGYFSLRSNSTGSFNTAVGAGTLLANISDENTATGAGALLSNTTGDHNTANGAFALFSNTSGGLNTANGADALSSNTVGTANTANGVSALLNNTSGHDNTATGLSALYSNTVGVNNTADGSGALFGNIDGGSNTAVGAGALLNNTGGASNTATGFLALYFNTTGHDNIALGANAGSNLTTESFNIDIGNPGVAGDSNTIRIGTPVNAAQATYISGIRGQTTGINDAIPVLIDSQHQLGTVSSSRRFKKDIKPMDNASEAILSLNPVTFHYNSDKRNRPEFGLIAEEVAKANPDLVVRDGNGQVYTVRYDAVNAMLLNEFLKEHRAFLKEQCKVEAQEKTIAELKSGVTVLAATVKDQAAQIQKVNARLEASKPAAQVVNNP